MFEAKENVRSSARRKLSRGNCFCFPCSHTNVGSQTDFLRAFHRQVIIETAGFGRGFAAMQSSEDSRRFFIVSRSARSEQTGIDLAEQSRKGLEMYERFSRIIQCINFRGFHLGSPKTADASEKVETIEAVSTSWPRRLPSRGIFVFSNQRSRTSPLAIGWVIEACVSPELSNLQKRLVCHLSECLAAIGSAADAKVHI